MNAAFLAPMASARCAFAIYLGDTPVYTSPVWRAYVGEEYAPPIPPLCREAMTFPAPVPHTAIRNAFSLRGREYTLFTLLPQAAEAGDTRPPAARLMAAADLFRLLLWHTTGEAPRRACLAGDLFATICRLLREEISVSCHTETDGSTYMNTGIDRDGLMLAAGIALPCILAGGGACASLHETAAGCRMHFSGRQTVDNTFLRGLLTSLAEAGGFGVSFLADGVAFDLPYAPPTSYVLYSRPADEDVACVRIGLMIQA